MRRHHQKLVRTAVLVRLRTDQSVRKFTDGLGTDVTIKTFFTFTDGLGTDVTIKTFFTLPDRVICRYAYSSTSLEQGLSRVVPAAMATTQAKPHAQRQLARELKVGRAAMGQRRRPRSLGEVQQGNPQPC